MFDYVYLSICSEFYNLAFLKPTLQNPLQRHADSANGGTAIPLATA